MARKCSMFMFSFYKYEGLPLTVLGGYIKIFGGNVYLPKVMQQERKTGILTQWIKISILGLQKFEETNM